MGMYTEMYLKCELKEDVPIDIIHTLLYMTNPEEFPSFENNVVFQTSSGRNPILGGSAYFDEYIRRFTYDNSIWFFEVQGNIKNYENEIEQFLDWIKPYIEKGIATKLYEEYKYESGPVIYYEV